MARNLRDDEYACAVQRAAQANRSEPRAVSARYDRKTHRIIVELRSGATLMFPPELAQGLANASTGDLSRIEISPSGGALRWPTLDADFSLTGLVIGVFGSKAWMSALKSPVRKPPRKKTSRHSASAANHAGNRSAREVS